uniref:ly6/PLAUR domain-containing protein 2-like n=1 Tax=Podarcis muralis TaxID=64176 RepID=UPI00109FCB0D|nr:ly6/PLAUR domain-containing protein 2-like [Podarcis muralis]
MKAFLAVALAFLASLKLGLCLQCYNCQEPTDFSNCLTFVNCSADSTHCKITVHSVDSGYPFFGNITVTKSCAKNCVPSEPDGIGETRPAYCCDTDLCNVGSGQQARAAISATAFIATLAFGLLWTRL